MQNETVGHHFQAHLNGEDCREEVIEIVEDLEEKSKFNFKSCKAETLLQSLNWSNVVK